MFYLVKFKIVQQIYDSRALKLSKNKIAKIHEYDKLNIDFLVHRRYSYSPGMKTMTEDAENFCIDAIMHNCNLSKRKIVNLLSESKL